VNETGLITTFSRLYHAADRGAWQSIQQHGLLSTSSLLDLYEIQGEQRIVFESQRRRTSMTLAKKGYSDIALRDQSPMTDEALNRCLIDGMTPQQWYESLNGKVFFWTSERRLHGLLTAKATREATQLVLTVDTRSLVSAHRERIFSAG
jgi:hypothetical protein